MPELNFNKEWVTDQITFETVEWAEQQGKDYASDGRNKVTTSKLRKFFGELREIESDYDGKKENIPLLKVKLAYAVGKANRRSKLRLFYDDFSQMLNAYKENSSKITFNRMVKIIEAIVAFHKKHGGE